MRKGIYISNKTERIVRIERLCKSYSNDEEKYILFTDGSNDNLLMKLEEFEEEFRYLSL